MADELTKDQVLKRDIPWETYMTAKMITGTDLQLLRRYDHRSREVQAGLLDGADGPAYIRTFMTVLRNVSKEETIEYVLAMLEDLIAVNPARASLLHDKSLSSEDIYGPLLRLLQRRNWFILERACKIITLVLSTQPKAAPQTNGASSSTDSPSSSISAPVEHVLAPFLEWLLGQLKHPAHSTKAIANVTSALAALLREAPVRAMFVKSDGVRLLAPQITPASSQQQIQLLYETVLCVWLVTFYEPSHAAIHSAKILPKLVEVAKTVLKEKVVRVAILSIKNLFDKYSTELVESGFLRVVMYLKLQSWSDDDLKAALDSLEESLRANIKVMSSFEKYKKEVLSGSLDWTPMHKDPAFWKENINHFEDHDFQVLRVLVSLLEASKEPKTLAVACWDIGQFIQHHPAGRGIALDLKAKERVMTHMANPDPEVQKQALLCVQKLLLSSKYTSYLEK